MPFSPHERASLLALKGIGPTVIERLEQLGYDSLAALAGAQATDICAEAALLVGTTCWKNSPQALGAVASAIRFAEAATHAPGSVSPSNAAPMAMNDPGG